MLDIVVKYITDIPGACFTDGNFHILSPFYQGWLTAVSLIELNESWLVEEKIYFVG